MPKVGRITHYRSSHGPYERRNRPVSSRRREERGKIGPTGDRPSGGRVDGQKMRPRRRARPGRRSHRLQIVTFGGSISLACAWHSAHTPPVLRRGASFATGSTSSAGIRGRADATIRTIRISPRAAHRSMVRRETPATYAASLIDSIFVSCVTVSLEYQNATLARSRRARLQHLPASR